MIIDILREKMKEQGIDCYIIPTLDPHSSEYLPDYFKERQFVTGFTGSAGTAIVTVDRGYLWTDGRYFIQAKSQIKDNGFELMKMGIDGYPTMLEWLKENIKSGSTIGLNAKYYLQTAFEELQNNLPNVNIVDSTIIDTIWQDRPELPSDKIYEHELKYAGKSSIDKIKELRTELDKKNRDLIILSKLDDIAWLFNIRGNDISHTPVVVSYAIVEKEKVFLFIDENKLDDKTRSYLEGFCDIKKYDEIFEHVQKYIDTNVLLDKALVNHKLYTSIDKSNDILSEKDIVGYKKSLKTQDEIKNIKNAHIRDGVALTKFIYWVKKEIKKRTLNEYEVGERLRKFREEQDLFVDVSFDTIAAYGPNGAMMHYRAEKETASDIYPKGFLLVDSGGQYLDGTTDITRTLAMGPLSEEEIFDFTHVLKSHLMMSECIFLKGMTDRSLDAIARYSLWQNRSDYKCGTGHGVGYFLGVHEQPPTISPKSNNTVLEEGMFFSDEPGVYKEGKFGIRIENLVVVAKDMVNESGTFYKLDMVSFAPIEVEAIDVKLLSDKELLALNKYHKAVYEKISPYLNDDEKTWLYEVTKELKK